MVPKVGSHNPALDGIRGIAIILVMIYHSLLFTRISMTVASDKLYYRIVNSYWLGVDIFFVLSGFLITGLLYDTRENRRFFTTFYARRALRIFPVYYAALFVLFWIRPFFAASQELTRISMQGQLWYWGYAANLLIAMKGWSPFSLGLLDHYWTLAVEEQFYLIWPLIVFFFRRCTLIIICGIGIVVSLGLRVALVSTGHIVPAYVLTFARMDTLAVGALIALVARDPRGFSLLAKLAWPVAGATSVGLLAIALRRGGLFKSDPIVLSIGLTLLAFLGGALIVLASVSHATTPLGKILGSASLRFFGRHSYALYVFHQPVFIWLYGHAIKPAKFPSFMGSELPGEAAFMSIAVSLSLVLALLSSRFLERPFLRLKELFPYDSHASVPRGRRVPATDIQAEHVL